MLKTFYHKYLTRYEIVAPNIFLSWDNEMDLAGVRKSGYLDEIEMKVSLSDYKADFKKVSRIKSLYKCYHSESYSYTGYYHINKHKAVSEGKLLCNYFSFLITEEMEGKCDIPNYAGLYVYYKDNRGDYRVKEVKKPKLLHKKKISDHLKYEMGRKMAYRYWKLI